MTTTSQPSGRVTSIRLPRGERDRIERLAGELGESRSRVLRAAFIAAERQDRDVWRFWLEKLPGGAGRDRT